MKKIKSDIQKLNPKIETHLFGTDLIETSEGKISQLNGFLTGMPERISQLILISLVILASSVGKAYLVTNESGEINFKNYRVGLEPQFKLSDGSGVNFSTFFDAPISEDQSVRARLGFGDTDFYAGGSWKWIPFPDFGSQPAIGGKVEGIVGREGGDSLVNVRFHPIVSKKFELELGTFLPYGSIPLGIQNFRSQNDFQAQLNLGSEVFFEQLPQWNFGTELGFNLSKAYTSITISAAYLFSSDWKPKKSQPKRKY